MALTDNLVAYYKLDGNSNDSVGSNNGTDTSISYSTSHSIINQGADLGGTSKITLSSLGLTSAFSITGWFYAASYTGFKVLFGIGDAIGPSTNSIAIWVNSNKIELDVPDSVDRVLTCTDTLTNGVRYFYAATYDGSNMKISINAGTQYSLAHTGNVHTVGPTQIGMLGTYYGFTGTEDEIAIWSRAITPTEITSLYNAGAGLQYPFSSSTNSTFLMFM